MKLRRNAVLAAFTLWALAGALVARAGDNFWTSIGPDGGQLSEIVFHQSSPNVMYARGWGGFYRSTDGGAHWRQPNAITTRVRDIALDPTNHDRIYLAVAEAPSRLLVSNDAGLTFSTQYTFPISTSTPNHIAVSADGNTIYVICYTGVFRSTDRGHSFQPRTDIGSISVSTYNTVVDPADANTLYVIRDDRLQVTRDGAGTWSDITPPIAGGNNIRDIAIDPTNPNTLYVPTGGGLARSHNRGASWSTELGGMTMAAAIDPISPSVVYTAMLDGRVFRRAGGAWVDITSNLGSFSPEVIAVSPHQSGTVAVSNSRGLWMTTNAATSWARSDAGLTATAVTGFAVADDRVYLKGNALGRLSHGSDTVIEVSPEPLFQLTNHKYAYLDAVAALPESDTGLLVGFGPFVARSIDDGANWNLTGYTTAFDDAIVDLAATTSTPSVYYASSQLTLKKSVDQGATWTQIGTGLPGTLSPGLIAIAPSNPSILYAAPRRRGFATYPGAGLYKSSDAGNTWTPANTGIEERLVEVIAVHPVDPNIVYVASSFALLKTSDGGAHWEPVNWATDFSAEVTAILIDPRAPDTLYVAGGRYGDGRVARSTDGGSAWTQLGAPATNFPWTPKSLALDPTRGDTLRVGTERNGIQQLSLRPDLQPDLAIAVTPRPSELPLNVPTAFVYTVSNAGSGPSGNVEVRLSLGANLIDVTATPSAGTCSVAGLEISCSAPPLNANESMSITVSVTPTAIEMQGITASVFTDRLDAESSNNRISHGSSVVERADLAVAMNGPTSGLTGDPLQYTITVTNWGPSPATGVNLTYQPMNGMPAGTFSITAGSCSSVDTAVVCEIPRLDFGATVTLRVTASAVNAFSYQLRATISAREPDGMHDNVAFVTTEIALRPVAPSPPSGGGGGGGGGSMSPLILLGLAALMGRGRSSRRAARGHHATNRGANQQTDA